MLNWAKQDSVHLLPATFTNPVTPEIIGTRPRKDPLAPVKLPRERCAELIDRMNAWELSRLGPALVLPCRAEEFTGLVISDVDQSNRVLSFGSRFGGLDFTKGRTAFRLPFPRHLDALFRYCAAGRTEGPLLSLRAVHEGRNMYRPLPIGRNWRLTSKPRVWPLGQAIYKASRMVRPWSGASFVG